MNGLSVWPGRGFQSTPHHAGLMLGQRRRRCTNQHWLNVSLWYLNHEFLVDLPFHENPCCHPLPPTIHVFTGYGLIQEGPHRYDAIVHFTLRGRICYVALNLRGRSTRGSPTKPPVWPPAFFPRPSPCLSTLFTRCPRIARVGAAKANGGSCLLSK